MIPSDEFLNTDAPGSLARMGESLRLYREYLLEKTQVDMAKMLGISRSTYLRMEKGDPRIPIGHWVNIWRRLYFNKPENLTVLESLLRVIDPGEAIVRAQADRALMERLAGDAVEDTEAAVTAIQEHLANYVPSPPDEDEDDLIEIPADGFIKVAGFPDENPSGEGES